MKFSRRTLTAVLVAAIIVFAAEARAEKRLAVGVLPIADALLLHVAEREGYFAEQGLAVELIPFHSALEKDAAAQAGRLNGHFCEISSVIVQRAAGLPFVAVAGTSHTNGDSRMFGLVTSPASASLTLAELRGKSVAVARQTIVDFLTDVFLAEATLPEDYLIRRDIRKIPVRIQMLLAGQVDAALLPEPLLSIAEEGGGRVLLDDRNLDMPLAVIALTDETADPATVRAFRAALTKAAEAINLAPEKYRPLMLELRLIPPQLAGTFKMPYLDTAKIPDTLPSPALFQAYVDWLIKNGVLAEAGTEARPGALIPPRYEDVVWSGETAAAPGLENDRMGRRP